MLIDRPAEQMVLFKEIMNKKVTVREAERAARNIAVERARKAPQRSDPVVVEIEAKLQEILGERVHVEQDAVGGRVTISFLTPDDLKSILEQIQTKISADVSEEIIADMEVMNDIAPIEHAENMQKDVEPKNDIVEDDSDLYDMSSFSL